MKFEEKTPKQPKRKLVIKKTWLRWFLQIGIYLVFFAAGAAVYRSGIIRPLTLQIRAILTDGLSAFSLPAGVKNTLNEVTENISDEARLYINNDLQTLYIDIGFEEYQKLAAKRNEALRAGILISSDDDFVPASLHVLDGDPLNVEMRLKGDWTDHLQEDEWSFRIKIKDNGAVFGAKEFNIQMPETRNYLWEWAFHQNLMQEGLLTTRYDFANVVINGELVGIYAVEDAFTTELIESQGRRQGVLLRFDEDILWETRANFWDNDYKAEGMMIFNDFTSAAVTPFKSSKIAEDPILTAEAETARNLLTAFQRGEKKASEVFDVPMLGEFFAMSDLWAGCHGLLWHNLRYYYNPVSTLLEPIAYDNTPFTSYCDHYNSVINWFPDSGLFDDPEVRAAYVEALSEITNEAYINQIQAQLVEDEQRYQKALQVQYPQLNLSIDWEGLKIRAQVLNQEIHPTNPVRANYQIIDNNGIYTLVLDVTNLMLLPLELVQVQIGDMVLTPPDGNQEIPMVQDPDNWVFEPVQFEFPLEGVSGLLSPETQVTVSVQLKGLKEEIAVTAVGQASPLAQKIGPLPPLPTLDEVLKNHPFLQHQNPDMQTLIVESGNWLVRGDLVLPYGYELIISPGTSLRFEPGAVLLAYGAVQIPGTITNPVVITSQDSMLGWGGMVVLNAQKDSSWQNTIVENTTGIEREGWILTGGITFYRSNITLDHVFIGNNQTEDAINVIHSEFHFLNSEFANTFADAFDSDYSAGEIVNCDFHDIAGDAIDVSGTKGTVKNTRMVSIVDKAVSVGEISNMLISNVVIDQVGIGIASKDRSTVVVEGSEINNAGFAALAAYIKKPVYGPASIEAANIQLNNNTQNAIAQTDSVILLWGEPVETVLMNVDLLYDQQILGN